MTPTSRNTINLWISIFPTNISRDYTHTPTHTQTHTHTSSASGRPTKSSLMPLRSVRTESADVQNHNWLSQYRRERETWLWLRVQTPPLYMTCTHTHHHRLLFPFVSLLSIPRTDEIMALFSFQLLRFEGIWETFQWIATDHRLMRSLLPSRVIL